MCWLNKRRTSQKRSGWNYVIQDDTLLCGKSKIQHQAHAANCVRAMWARGVGCVSCSISGRTRTQGTRQLQGDSQSRTRRSRSQACLRSTLYNQVVHGHDLWPGSEALCREGAGSRGRLSLHLSLPASPVNPQHTILPAYPAAPAPCADPVFPQPLLHRPAQ